MTTLHARSIGVVIGRFQIHELHEGHLHLLDSVSKKHRSMLILLGCRDAQPTEHEPLNFEARHLMLRSRYPHAHILPVFDDASDEVWSARVDAAILAVHPVGGAILYGSRDSFIPHYLGKYLYEGIEARENTNATSIRTRVSEEPIDSADFRAGVLYATKHRFAVSYQTVDIAIYKRVTPEGATESTPPRVLLGKRHVSDEKWRFPGGFVNPKDTSLEAAARREAREECGDMELGDLTYVASHRVDDWRYRGSDDAILTGLFTAEYLWGHVKAGDDLAVVQWFDLHAIEENIVHEHKPLARIVATHLQTL